MSYSETSQVDILPIDSSINIKDYDTVVIGASIRYGKYREEIFEFIKENEELLNSKDNAFFSVNVVARKENKNKPETNPYLIKFFSITFNSLFLRSNFLFHLSSKPEGNPGINLFSLFIFWYLE